jgi:hypothetical protein
MPEALPERMNSRRWLAWALALAGLQAVLLAGTAWDKSDTADEPYYLATAVDQWTFVDFSRCDAPALPRWGFAAALRLVDAPLFDPASKKGRHPLWSRPMPQGRRNLSVARMATIGVTVGGGLLLWLSARRFGDLAALVAHALWCLSPTVLAHGSLATLDAWAASLGCLVMWTTIRFTEAPTLGRAALVGLVLALAAAAKVTTLGLVPVAVAVGAWAVVRAARRKDQSAIGALLRTGAAGALAIFLTLWAVYGFSVDTIDTAHLCGKETGLTGRTFGPLPLAQWFSGILLQWRHGSSGHLSYLFGRTSSSGWWWFYLACLALKTTLGAQALAALLLMGRLKPPRMRESFLLDIAILAYPVLLVELLSLGKTQNGIRYILPAFPFAMLWAARCCESARALWDGWGRRAVAAALLVGAIESLAVHPHHLMFFNLWAGGPKGGPRYLVHGDDWGQDQRRLGEWQGRERPWQLFYTYYNGVPHYWGISAQAPPCEPRPGHYALHAIEVHRPKRLPRGCLDWLTVEPPDERFGYSIYHYLVTRSRIERLVRERTTIEPFWRSGPAPGAPPLPSPSAPSTPPADEPDVP